MNYHLVLNNSPYTFIEWGILSLYGLFLYKLSTLIMVAKESTSDMVVEESASDMVVEESTSDMVVEESASDMVVEESTSDVQDKIISEKQKHRCIVIVKRTIKSASTDNQIRKQIAIYLKENGYSRPYFLSTFNDPDYNKPQHESRIAHEILNRFLIKLYKTNHSLVIMNRNNYEWEYEPYITLGEMNNIHIEIVYRVI
jgi:hypothetical protein